MVQLVSVNSVIVDQLMAFVEACTIWPLSLPSYNALTASKALTLVTSYLERLNSPDLVKPTKLRPVTWTVAGEKTIAKFLEHVWQDSAKNPKICEAVLESLSSLRQFGYMQSDIKLEGVLWELELLVAHKANLEKMGEQWKSSAAAVNRLMDTVKGMSQDDDIRRLCTDIRESLHGDDERRF